MFAIAPKIEEAYINQHIALCRLKEGINKKYIGYWIISKSGGNFYLNKMTKGATKAGLGLDDIKNLPIPIAPFKEQEKIVSEIEFRLDASKQLEKDIFKRFENVSILRQSILKKAFEGKLI